MAYKETLGNPFLSPPSTARKIGIFEARSRAGTPEQIAIDRKFRAEQQESAVKDPEHILTTADLQKELIELKRPDLCENIFKCDPWKVEPVLLDALLVERSKEEFASPARIERLRKLIRAASWFTYERTDANAALRPFEEIVKQETKRQEERIGSRIRDAIRSSDTTEAKELDTALEQEKRLFRQGVEAFKQGKTGEEAEPAAQTVETLMFRAYGELKKLSIRHPGLSPEEAIHHPVGRAYAEEINTLRAARDWIYFRRCYPKRAATTRG